MNKKEVQKRVLQNGKPLDLDKFSWCEKTKTFSSDENYLVLDFKDINDCTFTTGSNCTFDTGYDCTFNTGSNCIFNTEYDCTFNTGSNCTFNTEYYCTFNTEYDCTFNTGSDCTFNTGSNCTFNTEYDCTFNTGSNCTFNTEYYCTFNTGSNCTFNTEYYCTFNTEYDCTFNTGSDCTFNTGSDCVVIRRDIFEVITLTKEYNTIKILPYGKKGYITKLQGEDFYHFPNETDRIEIIDNIVSKVISQKGNVLKVINQGEEKESYIVIDGEYHAHGATIKEAKESLIYKRTTKDLSEFESWKLDDVKSKEELILAYRSITGACETGVRYFLNDKDIKDKMTIQEAIDYTEGQYNWQVFKDFFLNN
jgi:hypothetical protein